LVMEDEMNNTSMMNGARKVGEMLEIMIHADKNGRKRAYRFSMPQIRWFPMPIKKAEAMLAAGDAVRTNRYGVQFHVVEKELV